MLHDSDRKDLESRLAKSVADLGLADILAKHSIPSHANVTLHIQQAGKTLASYKIGFKNKLPSSSHDIMKLKTKLDEFLNKSEANSGFLSTLCKCSKKLQGIDSKAEVGKQQFNVVFEIADPSVEATTTDSVMTMMAGTTTATAPVMTMSFGCGICCACPPCARPGQCCTC